MRFLTMWYVRPAKAQISLRICAYSMTLKLMTESKNSFSKHGSFFQSLNLQNVGILTLCHVLIPDLFKPALSPYPNVHLHFVAFCYMILLKINNVIIPHVNSPYKHP